MNRILIIIFFFCLSANIGLTQNKLSESAIISLLSCGSGDELASTFGHTAIRINDQVQNIDLAFHYGLYDFETPGFYTKFLRGKLMYSMGAQKMKNFVRQYSYQERTVYEQILNLNQTEKERVYRFLLENYKSENREYLYDFFFNNCSTIVRDSFETTFVPFQLPKSQEKDQKTYRNMLDENLLRMPWADYGIDLIIGSVADDTTSIRQQLFLPMYVHDHFNNTFIDGKALVSSDNLMLDFIEKRNQPIKNTFTPLVLIILFLVLELIIFCSLFFRSGKFEKLIIIYDKFIFLILGIGGLIILFMWFGTDHLATKNNYNLIWLNPLYLLFLFGKFRTSRFIRILLGLLIFLNLLVCVGAVQSFQQIHSSNFILCFMVALKLGRILIQEIKKGKSLSKTPLKQYFFS